MIACAGVIVVTTEIALLLIFNFFDDVLVAYFPLARSTSFTVQNPEAFVVTFPFFKVQEPDTDQTLVPVELVEAIDEVAYPTDGFKVETFHVTIGEVAAPTDGVAKVESEVTNIDTTNRLMIECFIVSPITKGNVVQLKESITTI